MTEQLTATTPTEPTPGRKLPRALTPFRHAAYRRLAVALVLTTFAGGVWVVGLVWEVIRIGGGPGQLSVVSTCGAVGVLLPALLGGVVADRVPAEADPALRRERRADWHGAGRDALDHRHHAALAPRGGRLRDRRGDGVLLPGLLGLAPRPGARGGPDGGQRVRGDGPARRSARRSAPASPASSSVRSPPGAALSVAAGASLLALAGPQLVPLTAVRREVDPDAGHSTRSGPRSPTCARASSTWSGRRGCWPRCCSPRS